MRKIQNGYIENKLHCNNPISLVDGVASLVHTEGNIRRDMSWHRFSDKLFSYSQEQTKKPQSRQN